MARSFKVTGDFEGEITIRGESLLDAIGRMDSIKRYYVTGAVPVEPKYVIVLDGLYPIKFDWEEGPRVVSVCTTVEFERRIKAVAFVKEMTHCDLKTVVDAVSKDGSRLNTIHGTVTICHSYSDDD